MHKSRRNVLKAGAGMAATGALASLAGCSQVPVVSYLMGGSAFYQDHLYAPGTVSDRDHYRFSAIRPADIENNEDEFEDETYDSFETYVEDQLFESHDLDIEDVETLTTVDNCGVTIVSGSYNVEEVVGVESGSTDRYVDAMEAANDLVNVLGDGTIVSGHTTEPIESDDPKNGGIERSVATGYATTVNGSEADVTAAAVFEDEGDVDAGDVDDWVEEHSTLNEADDLSESEQGRVGVVTGVIDTDEL